MLSLRTITVTLFSTACLMLATGCAGGGTALPSPSPSVSSSPTPEPTPLITIGGPANGETVPVPVAMTGTSDTFEAALTVDALDATGQPLCVRHIMATSGSGTPGTWETTLAFPPKDAEIPVKLRAYELSAKDGSMVNLVERAVTVSAERPPIIITTPACGDSVAPGGTLTVTGTALVFEAALTIELRDASGVAVATQNAMAASGSEESPWRALLTIPAGLAVGMYDLVAFDLSAKDGSIQDEFSIQIHVQ
jgi:hypothetical protein